MKARMKKPTAIRIMPVLALPLLAVLGVALAAGRDPVSGSGWANLVTGNEAEGEATLTIGGTTLDADVYVQITAMYFTDEEVLHAESSHTFTFSDGTLTTSDIVVGDPTDTFLLYTLNEKLTIVSGTGAYDGVSGVLTVHGQLNLMTGEVTYNIVGAISR